MISNQILQNTIDGLKGITRIDLCVLDMEGQTLASTEAQPENFGGEVAAFISSPADSQVFHGYQFFKVFDENQLEYILLAKGSSDDVYMVESLDYQQKVRDAGYKESTLTTLTWMSLLSPHFWRLSKKYFRNSSESFTSLPSNP